MIYREHAFTVVQTANLNEWKWVVQLEGAGFETGESHRRESAIGAAFAAIDRLITGHAATRSREIST